MKGTWQSGVGALALVGSGTALADYAYNLQTPASGVAQDVFQLHNLIMLVCLGIFVVVFTAMFYSLWKHRKSVGHQARSEEHTSELQSPKELVCRLLLAKKK